MSNVHELVALDVVGKILNQFGVEPSKVDVAKVLAYVVDSLVLENGDFILQEASEQYYEIKGQNRDLAAKLAHYTDAMNLRGIDSEEAQKLLEDYADTPGFVELATVARSIKRLVTTEDSPKE